MKLLDIVHRESIPRPWAEGEKIPWNDPNFSRKMLKEHLSQEHDTASRRVNIIDNHIRWIHNSILKKTPSRILDLGCGPGLYIHRLAGFGHRCTGIDFSPSSIAYAKKQAEVNGILIKYIEQDIRTADYGDGYELVMLIYGELNVFRPQEAKDIIKKAHHALTPGGHILLEPHSFETVRMIGNKSPSWYSEQSGLFLDRPHFCLQENFWDDEHGVAIQRYYIIDPETSEVTLHSASNQAYSDDQYKSLLADYGFGEVKFFSSLDGREDADNDFRVILAQKQQRVE